MINDCNLLNFPDLRVKSACAILVNSKKRHLRMRKHPQAANLQTEESSLGLGLIVAALRVAIKLTAVWTTLAFESASRKALSHPCLVGLGIKFFWATTEAGVGRWSFFVTLYTGNTLSYTRLHTEERLQSYVHLFDTNTFEPLAAK